LILERTGRHSFVPAESAMEALLLLRQEVFDLAIVDLIMPDISGLEFAETIREQWPAMAVILITGYNTDEPAMARAISFADAYLRKPADSKELLDTADRVIQSRRTMFLATMDRQAGRERMATRERLASHEGLDPISYPIFPKGDFELNLANHQVRIKGSAPIDLTRIESSLLYWLLKRSPSVVKYKELARLVKGIAVEQFFLSRLEAIEFLKDHVKRLRRKIEPSSGRPVYLHNKKGKGYYIFPDGGKRKQGERGSRLLP
jgi:DNA-binding response OmpR family regulator